jgi:hypothetical protein
VRGWFGGTERARLREGLCERFPRRGKLAGKAWVSRVKPRSTHCHERVFQNIFTGCSRRLTIPFGLFPPQDGAGEPSRPFGSRRRCPVGRKAPLARAGAKGGAPGSLPAAWKRDDLHPAAGGRRGASSRRHGGRSAPPRLPRRAPGRERVHHAQDAGSIRLAADPHGPGRQAAVDPPLEAAPARPQTRDLRTQRPQTQRPRTAAPVAPHRGGPQHGAAGPARPSPCRQAPLRLAWSLLGRLQEQRSREDHQ